jgi:hypothetical protein
LRETFGRPRCGVSLSTTSLKTLLQVGHSKERISYPLAALAAPMKFLLAVHAMHVGAASIGESLWR